MKLYLQGHNCRYAVEQLQLALFGQPLEYVEALFPAGEDGAVSALHPGPQWLTATCTITRGGKTVRASRRLRRDRQTPTLLRRILQQSYYLAAVKLLDAPPGLGCALRCPAHEADDAAHSGRRGPPLCRPAAARYILRQPRPAGPLP